MFQRVTRPVLAVTALTVAALAGAGLASASVTARAAAPAVHGPRHICALLEVARQHGEGDESGEVPLVVCVTPGFRDGSYRCVTVPRDAFSLPPSQFYGAQVNCVLVWVRH